MRVSGSQGDVASWALITKTATRASPPCRPFGTPRNLVLAGGL